MERKNTDRTNQNQICFDRMLDECKPNRCSSVESSVFELYHESRKFSTTPKKSEILKNQKCEPRTGSDRNYDVNHGKVQLCNNTDTPSLVNKANNVTSENQLGLELSNIREEINVKALYEEALKAYKPPVNSRINNSKNDDGKIKILKKPYKPLPNDLIIHVKSKRGIEVWTKVGASFSNENHIPSELKETKPVSKFNKFALKNLHRHLQSLITEDDPKDDETDYLRSLYLHFCNSKSSIPDVPDPWENKKEDKLYQFCREGKSTYRQDPLAYNGVDFRDAFLLSNLEADVSKMHITADTQSLQKNPIGKNKISSNVLLNGKKDESNNPSRKELDKQDDLALGEATRSNDSSKSLANKQLQGPLTTIDPPVPNEFHAEIIELPNSEVETNSEEQSTINNSKESSQDASINQERPRARRYECSKCGRSFVNEILLQMHREVRHLGRSPASEEVDRSMDSADP